MADVFVSALQNYLSGAEWRESVELFVDANCGQFHSIDEPSHEQHGIWRNFQGIVESVLAAALDSVGCSYEALEKALDEVTSIPSRGPRDDVVKDVLEKLAAVESFYSFSEMMHQSFLSRQSQQTIADNFDKPPISSHHFYHVSSSDDNGNSEAHRQALLHLGFDEEAVDDLYASKKHRGASLEELVMQLSATRMDERKEGSNDDFYIQEKLRLQANSNPSFGNPHGQVPIYLLKYAEDAAISDLPELEEYLHSASTNGESSAKDSRDNSQVAATVRCHEFAHDMQLKFSMAESVLDTFGPVEEHDPGDGVADLVEWATSMACLNTEIQAAYFEGIPFREMRFTHSEGLYQLFRDLERIRLAIDKDSTHGGILSDAEMWRMEELDMIASIGTEDEQILHRLFRRNDELTAELNMLHKRFRVMIATDRGVKRENLEELYLFLKEQISNGTDLDIVSDELNDHVFSLIPANRSGEVVDMLLNMHLFEDEQMLVKDKIHSLVGSPNKIAGNSLLSDDAMGKEYDVNRLRDLKIYGESSTSRIDAKANSFTSSDIADGKSTNTLASIERPYSLIAVDDPFKDDNEKLLSEVKSNHKSMLANLQLSLEQQKEAKLRDLEQKLLRRKAQRNRLQKEKDASKTTSEEDESMIDSLDLDIAELDQRIAGIVDYFKEVEEHMAIGLRKRCVLEAKAIKTTAATNSGKCRILSEEEKTSVNREAANLLKNQYERDQLSLLDALSAERERQRKKILQRLANRKSNGESDSGSKENGDEYFREYEEAAIQELAEVNRAFDQEEVAIMTASHNKSLLALAAVQINSTLLVESNLVEADDDYFGDENADHKELGSEKNKWWGTVELLRNEYTKTGRNLHLHLQKTYQQDAAEQDRVAVKTSSTNNTVNDENSCEGNVFNEITTQMINVVTNAFHRDLEELQIWKGNDLLSNFEKNSNTKTQDNLANNILLEFEKAEGKFDRVLEIAQQKSREKLRERQRQRSGYCYGKAEESMISNGKNDVSSINISCMLKKAVEEFLLDPTTIPQNDNAKSNTSFDQTIKKLVNYPKETLRRDDKGSIEVDDFEKSFDLDKDRLKAKYTETEQKQMTELQNTMLDKRRALENRLKRRQMLNRSTEGNKDYAKTSQEEEELRSFEKALQQMKIMMSDGRGKDVLARIRGQEDLFKVLESLHEISGKADSSMIENKCSNPVNSQDSKDPDSWETPRSTNSDHTTVISGPRLSNIYVDQETDLMDKVRERRERDNEERRKLDLKTQIERMRQKEMLRKRVLERQQIAKSTANNLSTTGSTNSIPITSNYRPPSIRAGLGAGAGYSSCDGIGFTNMASPQKTETHEHVDLISSKKTGSFLSQRKMQEPFKGLGDYAKNHPLAGTEVGKAPSNSVIAASKDLASRGLGLTNMVKKK